MRQVKYSFKQACNDANVTRWLDDWDYEKNQIDPSQVAAHTNKKYWFKCHRGLHEPTSISLHVLTINLYRADEYNLCKACNSIGQYIVDYDGADYLECIWSDKNIKNPYEISRRSSITKIWLRCLDNPSHPDYDLAASNYVLSHNCPYCSGKRLTLEHSLGFKYPESFNLWSNMNTKSPNEYSYGTNQIVWWKCENGIHNDYERRIDNSILYNFRCPFCGKENQEHPSGENHPNWKGGVTPQHKIERQTKEYEIWRNSVYERDKYVCQVCLNTTHHILRAHHFWSFQKYPKIRLDINNGITCCEECHDTTYIGSFHQIYGTHNNTPEQFQEYANNRRKQLGINIPFNIYDYMGSDFTEQVSQIEHQEENLHGKIEI